MNKLPSNIITLVKTKSDLQDRLEEVIYDYIEERTKEDDAEELTLGYIIGILEIVKLNHFNLH